MNACLKFHGDESNSIWDISIKSTDVSLMMALEEKSEDHKVCSYIPLEAIDVYCEGSTVIQTEAFMNKRVRNSL